MNQLNFFEYNEDAENGDYIEFANMSAQKIVKISKAASPMDLYPDYLANIAINIKSKELKDRFIEKLRELFLDEEYKSIERYDYTQGLKKEIFSEKEIKSILESEISKRKKAGAIYVINNADVSELEWRVKQIEKILKLADIKDKIEIEDLNLILAIRDKATKDTIIKKYENILPYEYKKYQEVENDPQYVLKKSEKYLNEKIGIDPRISIGPEIEANNKINIRFKAENQKIKESLNNAKTQKSPYTEYGQYQENKTKMEATVYNGIEVVIPKFHDTPEEVAYFCAMCETMKEQGYYYDEECQNAAGQINLGIDYLDSAKAILNFIEIFGNVEELLFHISNAEGQLTRQAVYCNSRFKAISERIGNRIVDEEITREDVIQLLTARHEPNYDENKEHIENLIKKQNTICLRAGNRFEIRIPNGSTDFRVWIDNIRLFGKMMEVAKRCADIFKQDECTYQDVKLLELKEELKNPNATLEEKLYILMDLLFEDDETKNIYINRFYALEKSIQKTQTKKYKDFSYRSEPAFGEVDFEETYYSAFNLESYGKNTVVYDPKLDDGKKDSFFDQFIEQ